MRVDSDFLQCFCDAFSIVIEIDFIRAIDAHIREMRGPTLSDKAQHERLNEGPVAQVDV